MSINTKTRLTILASVVALAFAAPAAFAQTGTTDKKGIHTEAGGTPDAPAPRHTEKVMKKKVASKSAAAPDAGKTDKKGIHTDPGGTPDAPAARHSPEVMKK